MVRLIPSFVLMLLFAAAPRVSATQEPAPEPGLPFRQTPEVPGLDSKPAPTAPAPGAQALPTPEAVGPISPAGAQPTGALTGRIVFTSGGHGWDWVLINQNWVWSLGRPLLLSMNEDYGNLDEADEQPSFGDDDLLTDPELSGEGEEVDDVIDNPGDAALLEEIEADDGSVLVRPRKVVLAIM